MENFIDLGDFPNLGRFVRETPEFVGEGNKRCKYIATFDGEGKRKIRLLVAGLDKLPTQATWPALITRLEDYAKEGVEITVYTYLDGAYVDIPFNCSHEMSDLENRLNKEEERQKAMGIVNMIREMRKATP